MSKDVIDLSDEITYYLDIILNMFLTPTLAALGIVGNVFNIIILYRHGYNDITNILLTAVAIADLLYSIFTVFIQSVYIHEVTDVSSQENLFFLDQIILNFVYPCQAAIFLASSMYTCIIALTRAVAVSLPLRVNEIFTMARIQFVVLLIPLFTFKDYPFYIIPVSSDPNVTIFWCSCNMYNEAWQQNYCIFTTFTYYIPQAMAFVCLVVIVIQLFRRRDRLKQMTHKSKISRGEIKTTKTLCVIFVVEIILSQDYMFYYIVTNSYSITANVNYIYYSACNCYYQFFSSFNFFVYVAMSSKFSESLKHLLKIDKI